MTVYAAGVLGWRNGPSGLEFVLVNREKYQDWAFAKGKQDPGEFLPETAVREFFEETGLKVRLGRKLDVMTYPLPDGETKEVHYWVGKVTEKAQRKSKFVPNEEIAGVEWFGRTAALERLTYDHDKELLRKVIALEGSNQLDTMAIVVLRHATATPRSEWKSGEDTRPLLPSGKLEAKRLTSLLDAYGPKLLVTSSWRRCKETLMPTATYKKRKLIERSQLSELGSDRNPKRLKKLLIEVMNQNRDTVICTHRPAIPKVLRILAKGAKSELQALLEENKNLKPGEFVIARYSRAEKTLLVAVERFSWDRL